MPLTFEGSQVIRTGAPVPSPDVIGRGGGVTRAGFCGSWLAGTSASFVEAVLCEDAVEGRFGSDVGAFVKEVGHDLGGRQGGEALAVAEGDDLITFLLGELVGLMRPRSGGAFVADSRAVEVFLPAGEGAIA